MDLLILYGRPDPGYPEQYEGAISKPETAGYTIEI